ncbi:MULTISPECIES: hypothetical protein [Helcobacillus]|uniref:Uncharacterized protein n=1 Tax=Helcobacillus massiliensis TaxID=521392 RepID=A0A839QT14_9MICO|nr:MULTISPECIES: hypothetical protein [Helcobacillus]MBB3022788.1 hypothetical protein [Helcobacillus massiliensis]MCG7427527.1 hypothetical protein [Helcobacillus sp. ACRRO]
MTAQPPSAPRRPLERIAQFATGAVLGVLSAFVLIGMHRVSAEIGGVTVPWGLAFGALFQVVACVLVVAWFDAKLPLIILAAVFALLALMFSGPSPGGGILMPAEVNGEAQYSGWLIQLIGVLIPLIAAAGLWAVQIAALRRAHEHSARPTTAD